MPETYYRQISTLYRKSVFLAILSCLLVVFLCIAIAGWTYNFVFGCLFSVAFLLTLFFFCYANKKPRNKLNPWIVSIPNVATFLDKKNLHFLYPGIFFCIENYYNMRIRMLIQYENQFNRELVAKNRNKANYKANKTLGIKQVASNWEIMRMLRINLLICNNSSNELLNWVQSTSHSIRRAESIFNFAYIRSEDALIVPALQGSFEVSQVRNH